MQHHSYHTQGFSMVEIIVSATIFLTAVVGFIAAFSAFSSLTEHTAEQTAAALLLEEGAEAMQLLRDEGWDTRITPLVNGQQYHLYWTGSSYVATSTQSVIGEGYYRRVTLSAVRRNASDVVAESGTIDTNTRQVTIDILRASDGAVLATSDVLIHNVYEAE